MRQPTEYTKYTHRCIVFSIYVYLYVVHVNENLRGKLGGHGRWKLVHLRVYHRKLTRAEDTFCPALEKNTPLLFSLLS